MDSVSFGSGDETADTADGQNDRKFSFKISRLGHNGDKPQDIEKKDSDLAEEDINLNNDPITSDKKYGFSFKSPRMTSENLQPGGNIVRDSMIKARPDSFEYDHGLEDNQAVETNTEAANPVVNYNNSGERHATASLTSDVASSSNPLIHKEGILSSRSTEENEEEAEQTYSEEANIGNLPMEIIPKAGTCKCKQVENVVEEEEHNVIRYNDRALPKHADTYELESFQKNAMIIFNQKNIVGFNPREGTEKDVDMLYNTFRPFGFEIDPQNDLDRDQIFKKLDTFSKQDFTDYGCIAVVILTHGFDKGSLCAKKGWNEVFFETDVIDYFGTSLNETLVTKPIIFIIQACRGKNISKAKLAGKPGTVRKDSPNDSDQSYTLPVESDMLVLHSTYPGKMSHRNDREGSWFIQTLCEKINQLSPNEDLESIMTATKRAVAIDREHMCPNKITFRYEINKQMPVAKSTLIRKLFLRKYMGCIPRPITRDSASQVDGCSHSGSIEDVESVSDKRIGNPGPSHPDWSNCSVTDTDRIGNPGPSHPDWSNYFGYLKGMLRHFVEDPCNSEDSTAKSYLSLACTYKDSADFHDSKEEMSKIITEHLKKNAKHLDYYKFLYLK